MVKEEKYAGMDEYRGEHAAKRPTSSSSYRDNWRKLLPLSILLRVSVQERCEGNLSSLDILMLSRKARAYQVRRRDDQSSVALS